MEDKYVIQYKKVYKSFFNEPKSRNMASIEVDVPIQNVCWFVFMLREASKIMVAKKGYCKITKRLVEYLTTNPDHFPEDNQLALFE